ncbi:MAG: fused MFS/spermidine synthase [Patescibacteria group bacterium]|nr:fused MFS/spermidine synthase [Patescibacteria group bacterium]
MQKFINWACNFSILITLFITGACVLIIEVVAVRLLSPYFGNTIYSYSSILSVILAAISIGYYYGGKIADKTKDESLFYKIITASGVATGSLFLVSFFILDKIANNFSITTGPLISSIILFSIPAFLLGLLSPFGVTLENHKKKHTGVGTTSGKVFFVSTLGSISGSLLAGYFLIPFFGVSNIFVGVSLALILIGTIGNLIVKKNTIKTKNIVFGIFFFSTLLACSTLQEENFVYSKDGIYEKIKIIDSINHEKRPVRYMIQDRSWSSGIYLDTKELLFEYTKFYDINKIIGLTPKNALVIGSGAYSIPKAILAEYPNIEYIDTVDIEPILEDIAIKYFDFKPNSKIRSHTKDGRVFVKNSENKYDYIFIDVYQTFYSIPAHFTTKEFFHEIKRKLNNNGIVIMNIIASIDESEGDKLPKGILKTFASEFENSHLFFVEGKNIKTVQNLIVIGINSPKEIDIKAPMRFVNNLEEKHIPIAKLELSNYQIFTDNHAPIEYLSVKMYEKTMKQFKFNQKNQESILLKQISDQVAFGPRYVGSEGQSKIHQYLINNLREKEVKIIEQDFVFTGKNQDYKGKNIIAQINPQNERRILIGSHFDTLKISKDTGKPMIGANNGASGTAVLLAIVEELKNKENKLPIGVDIVFFDAEEGDPDIPPWENGWMPKGSKHFAANVNTIYPQKHPEHAIIIDVVCGKNPKYFYEINSAKNANAQMKKFWQIGKAKMPSSFIQTEKYAVIDDHTALIEIKIPTFLVIDMDYKYLHSSNDTIEKCDGKSLANMKDILIEYIYSI